MAVEDERAPREVAGATPPSHASINSYERNLEFLLVARHGSRDKDLKDVREVAQRLRETLRELPISVVLTRIWHSATPDALKTAAVFKSELGERKVVAATATGEHEALCLGPDNIGSYSNWPGETGTKAKIRAAEVAVDRHLSNQNGPAEANAVMLVGNQPAIDWFLADCVKGRIAVAAGEVVCLVRKRGSKGSWLIWWVITPTDPNSINELRQKVESKMTVLSVLAGFTVAVLASVTVELTGNSIDDGPHRVILFGAAVLLLRTFA